MTSTNDGVMTEQLNTAWYEFLNKLLPGKEQADYTPEDWGKVKAHVVANKMK